MTERLRAFALFVAATLLIGGAGVHALMGQAFVREALSAQQSRAELTGVLNAGWQLGSVSLLTFGILVLLAGLARWRGQPVSQTTLWIVISALVGFGIGALLLGDREFAFFYLGYLVIGALVGYGAASRREVEPGNDPARLDPVEVLRA